MARRDSSDETKLLGALSNPLRRQILRRMHNGEALSPLQLAEEFDLPVSNIAYHVRVLAGCGAVKLVRVKPVRGALKHFYRSSLEPPWARQIIDLEPWDGSRSGEIPDGPAT